MKAVDDFHNKVCHEIDKTYFPEVKFYHDNKNTIKIHYDVECFSNGVLTYPKLISKLSTHTKDTKENIHKIVSKYIKDWDGFTYEI